MEAIVHSTLREAYTLIDLLYLSKLGTSAKVVLGLFATMISIPYARRSKETVSFSFQFFKENHEGLNMKARLHKSSCATVAYASRVKKQSGRESLSLIHI